VETSPDREPQSEREKEESEANTPRISVDAAPPECSQTKQDNYQDDYRHSDTQVPGPKDSPLFHGKSCHKPIDPECSPSDCKDEFDGMHTTPAFHDAGTGVMRADFLKLSRPPQNGEGRCIWDTRRLNCGQGALSRRLIEHRDRYVEDDDGLMDQVSSRGLGRWTRASRELQLSGVMLGYFDSCGGALLIGRFSFASARLASETRMRRVAKQPSIMVADGRNLHMLFNVGRLVGQAALASRPADLPNCLAGLNGQRDGQLQLMTGDWLVTGFEPIFKVDDVARSVAWFERAGFEPSFHDETYAFAHRDRDLTIHLAQVVGDEPPGQCSLYIHCQDADQVATDWREAGIEVDGPRNEDYGKREGSITDPDGNVIRFGSPVR
jgi:hypothetical protein